jgi:hypothetical protein
MPSSFSFFLRAALFMYMPMLPLPLVFVSPFVKDDEGGSCFDECFFFFGTTLSFPFVLGFLVALRVIAILDTRLVVLPV